MDLGHNQRVFLFAWEGAAAQGVARHIADSVGAFSSRSIPRCPETRLGRKGRPSLCIKTQAQAQGQEVSSHPAPAWPAAAVPSRLVLPVACAASRGRGTTGERVFN